MVRFTRPSYIAVFYTACTVMAILKRPTHPTGIALPADGRHC
jgi:hypothetical protein